MLTAGSVKEVSPKDKTIGSEQELNEKLERSRKIAELRRRTEALDESSPTFNREAVAILKAIMDLI